MQQNSVIINLSDLINAVQDWLYTPISDWIPAQMLQIYLKYSISV